MQTEIVTTLKRQATRIPADVKQSREPVLITEHGQPLTYHIDVQSFEKMQTRMCILDGIAKGERAILENRLSRSLPEITHFQLQFTRSVIY